MVGKLVDGWREEQAGGMAGSEDEANEAKLELCLDGRCSVVRQWCACVRSDGLVASTAYSDLRVAGWCRPAAPRA